MTHTSSVKAEMEEKVLAFCKKDLIGGESRCRESLNFTLFEGVV